MRDLEDRMPDLLQGLAGEVRSDVDRLGRRTLRRARTRRALTASATTAAVAAFVVVGAAGVRSLRGTDAGLTPTEPSPAIREPGFRGIWPSASAEDLAFVQRQVDEGHQPWQLDAEMTAEAFAVNVLGWEPEVVESSLEEVAEAEAVVSVRHRDREELVTRVWLARLGQTGPGGVWTVVRADTDLLWTELEIVGGSLRISATPAEPASGWTARIEIADGAYGEAMVDATEAEGDGPSGAIVSLAPRSADGSLSVFVFAVDRTGRKLGVDAIPIAVAAVATPPAAFDLAELPPDVAATAQRILDAVEAGDVDALAKLVDPGVFVYDLDEGLDPLAAWREAPDVLDPVPTLLALPPTVQDVEGEGTFYVWPYLMAEGSLDRVSEIERADLLALGFSDAGIEEMAASGGYLGPRLAIDEGGAWRYYVTGGD